MYGFSRILPVPGRRGTCFPGFSRGALPFVLFKGICDPDTSVLLGLSFHKGSPSRVRK